VARPETLGDLESRYTSAVACNCSECVWLVHVLAYVFALEKSEDNVDVEGVPV
jgi:hypothetical protein